MKNVLAEINSIYFDSHQSVVEYITTPAIISETMWNSLVEKLVTDKDTTLGFVTNDGLLETIWRFRNDIQMLRSNKESFIFSVQYAALM